MRLHPVILGLTAALALQIGAASAVSAENRFEMNASDVSVSSQSDTLVIRGSNSKKYGLCDADGNPITEEIYESIYPVSSYPFFKVSATSADGVHDEGLIDDQGNILVPAKYADVNVISDRWQVGITLTPSSADDKDYTVSNWSTGDKEFYRIDQAVFFFNGQEVGSLPRTEYDGYPTAHGDYICVTDRKKGKTFYNSRFEKSPYAADSSSEYDTEYKNGSTRYYHQGTGEAAFTEGCTLTPEEVDSAYVYDKAVMYNLQGGVAFKAAQNYDYVRDYQDGYAIAKMNGMEGVIDESGKEIIPLEYESVGNYSEHPFKYGYISAVKDGKFGFLNMDGAVTCDFVYSADAVDDRGTFGEIQNLDGTVIVLSAAVGELPEHYKDVEFPSYYGGMCFVGINDAGEETLVDLFGNTMIPYGEYSISANADGTVAVIRHDYQHYEVCHFDPVEGVAPASSSGGDDQSAGGSDGTSAAWTCENGHEGNTGNFCAECGAPKPAADEAPASCAECGFEFPDGTVPKFCPNCGAPVSG